MRQALQRLACLFETCRDLVGIRPRRGIEPFGERKERLLPFGIRRALRNLLADRGIPLRQKRDLLVGGGAFDGDFELPANLRLNYGFEAFREIAPNNTTRSRQGGPPCARATPGR